MKKLLIYNTLGRKKQEFEPIKKNKATVYHCGPTVYWTQSIGNMRGMFSGDTVVRTLKYLGYETTHARNYTDVGHLTGDNYGDADTGEDRMEKAAKREGIDPDKIADKYIKQFETDVRALNMLNPDIKPRATEYIGEMIDMIGELIEKGFAYTTDLAVYFDVTKAKDYTALSGQNLEKNLCGEGTGDVEDKNKKCANDFALWFFRAGAHKNSLQYWDSPFKSSLVPNGEGFPGWHIECSVMAKKHLGNTIDIHLGGIEHVSIHHTNEIAQSEAANGVKFVNYWLHNEHLTVDGGKMSKSLGNVYSIDELKENGFEPLALRYFFLQAHYRSKQNFTWAALRAGQNGINKLRTRVRDLGQTVGTVDENFKNKFTEQVTDDFNTPKAMAVMSEVLKSDLRKRDKLATILDFDNVLGLCLNCFERDNENLPQEVQDLINKRNKAREEKDWNESDKLREKIEKLGYRVEDNANEMKVYKVIKN